MKHAFIALWLARLGISDVNQFHRFKSPAVPDRQQHPVGVPMLTRFKRLARCALLTPFCALTAAAFAQVSPTEGGIGTAPDEWLLVKVGNPWWYTTRPSPTPVQLKKREPSKEEAPLVERAQALMYNRPAKAIVLMDGDTVVYEAYKAPADADSTFFGFSMGKTVAAMAVGQAICAGHLRMDTKANELIPELKESALGRATVRDLLRMASGAAEPNPDSTIFTTEQFKDWNRGRLNLLDVVAEDRVSKPARGLFSEYKPGEAFAYKSSDPIVLGMMVARATRTNAANWWQQAVLDNMGAARPGLLVQDNDKNLLSDSGVRLRMEDWMRFAVWVKQASKASGCFGDFVRAALTTEIPNIGNSGTRKMGKLFAGFGYFTWTQNEIAPDTTWASGWGGQRIGWHLKSDRTVITFSNVENWMPELYQLARDWNQIKH